MFTEYARRFYRLSNLVLRVESRPPLVPPSGLRKAGLSIQSVYKWLKTQAPPTLCEEVQIRSIGEPFRNAPDSEHATVVVLQYYHQCHDW